MVVWVNHDDRDTSNSANYAVDHSLILLRKAKAWMLGIRGRLIGVGISRCLVGEFSPSSRTSTARGNSSFIETTGIEN